MANILKNNVTINFGDKVWSTNSILNSYPWALVGVESQAIFNGNLTDNQTITYDEERNEVVNHEYVGGGVDTYSLIGKNDFTSATDYSQAVTVGDMKRRDAEGHRIAGEGISGKLTINNGFYASPASAIYVAQGECIINGGVFFGQPDINQRTQSEREAELYPYGRSFLLNLYDANRTAGKAAIYVLGGSFIGFDPAENYAEGTVEASNFVCQGYKSVEDGVYTYMVKDNSCQDNGELRTVKVFTVVPASDPREGKAGNKPVPNN